MEQGVGGAKFGREAAIETSPGAKFGEGPNLKTNLQNKWVRVGAGKAPCPVVFGGSPLGV